MEVEEIVIKKIRERKRIVKNLKKVIKEIAKETKKLLGKDAKVYVFGSYLKGNFHPFLSDVDILIVSDKIKNLDDKVKISLPLKEKFGYIFQFHVVNEKEFEIYKFFIDKMKEIK